MFSNGSKPDETPSTYYLLYDRDGLAHACDGSHLLGSTIVWIEEFDRTS